MNTREIAELEAQLEDEGLNPQLEVEGIEAELSADVYAELMSTPPGPLKSRTRVRWHRRPQSGPTITGAGPDPEGVV